jgi:hypothetical protein
VGAAEPAVVECDAEPASRAGDREHDAFFSTMPRYAKQPARWRLALDQFPVCRRAEFPAGREKSREFFRFSRFFAKIRLENIFFSRYLRGNSLRIEQGIYLRAHGISSAFWTGAGNLARYPIASISYLRCISW